LRVLEGGCSVPVGVQSTLQTEREGEVLTLTGCVTAVGGERHIQHTLKERVGSREAAEAVGVQLARVLFKTGAKDILDDINQDRDRRVKEAKMNESATA
jgi:hydroxymethylbilane synthase